MAYKSLYRKYRPRNFIDVIGQDGTIRILKNQIINKHIGHAYLFSGIRGTGKTTIAKIFAKAINCENSHNGEPCQNCEVCQDLNISGNGTIIEIDAASNRGVEEIRRIREQATYAPTTGHYKVYIIDEAHMLTREAFNALLKILEEPPEHIIFVFATTEPKKIPLTILSRIQKFEIKPVPQIQLENHLKKILNEINVSMSNSAIQIIAELGEMSVRDSLSILDQCICLKKPDETIEQEDLLTFLGLLDRTKINKIVDALLSGETIQIISIMKNLNKQGYENQKIGKQIIQYLHSLCIIKQVEKISKKVLDLSDDEYIEYKKQADQYSFNQIYNVETMLIDHMKNMTTNSIGNMSLEILFMKICSMNDNRMTEENSVQMKMSSSLNDKKPVLSPNDIERYKERSPAVIIKEEDAIKRAIETPVTEDHVKEVYRKLLFQIHLLSPVGNVFLAAAAPMIDKDTFYLYFNEGDESKLSYIQRQCQEMIVSELKKITGIEYVLKLKIKKKAFDEMSVTEKTRAIIGDIIPVVEIC